MLNLHQGDIDQDYCRLSPGLSYFHDFRNQNKNNESNIIISEIGQFLISAAMTKSLDEAKLLKLAEAELLGEAKRAAVRHSIAGPSGWQPCPKTNKCFLINTLLQTLSSNRQMLKKADRRREREQKLQRRERKLLQKNEKSQSCDFIFKKPDEKTDSVKKTVHHQRKHRKDSSLSVKHKRKERKKEKKRKKCKSDGS